MEANFLQNFPKIFIKKHITLTLMGLIQPALFSNVHFSMKNSAGGPISHDFSLEFIINFQKSFFHSDSW